MAIFNSYVSLPEGTSQHLPSKGPNGREIFQHHEAYEWLWSFQKQDTHKDTQAGSSWWSRTFVEHRDVWAHNS